MMMIIINWPTPTTIKELHFLGLVNFYQRFIHGFSIIMSPLTSLLKKGPKKLQWNPSADQAFKHLKATFTSAPFLKHPDLSKPFIVEMDASETGVGAVLSQWCWGKPKFHIVAYFFQKLSPAKHNYDFRNWEFLAVKLEEWCHWLDGTLHPLTMHSSTLHLITTLAYSKVRESMRKHINWTNHITAA